MVVTMQCCSKVKRKHGYGQSGQGGLHSVPVVKELGFEKSEELVRVLVLRGSEFVGSLAYWKEDGFYNQRDLGSNSGLSVTRFVT